MATGGRDDPQKAFSDKLAGLEQAFRAKLPGRAAELETLLARALEGADDDARQISTLVHKLSGSAGSFGAGELSDAATAIDLRLRAGESTAEVASELRALIRLMRATASARPAR